MMWARNDNLSGITAGLREVAPAVGRKGHGFWGWRSALDHVHVEEKRSSACSTWVRRPGAQEVFLSAPFQCLK